MDFSEMRTAILMQIVWRIPYLIVYLVGIVLAMMNRTRKPAAAMLTLFALVLMLMTTILGGISGMLPLVLFRQHWPESRIGLVIGTFGLVRMLLDIGGIGLLLLAIFRQENRTESRSGEPEFLMKQQ